MGNPNVNKNLKQQTLLNKLCNKNNSRYVTRLGFAKNAEVRAEKQIPAKNRVTKMIVPIFGRVD